MTTRSQLIVKRENLTIERILNQLNQNEHQYIINLHKDFYAYKDTDGDLLFDYFNRFLDTITPLNKNEQEYLNMLEYPEIGTPDIEYLVIIKPSGAFEFKKERLDKRRIANNPPRITGFKWVLNNYKICDYFINIIFDLIEENFY
jgi:hypothetical protein